MKAFSLLISKILRIFLITVASGWLLAFVLKLCSFLSWREGAELRAFDLGCKRLFINVLFTNILGLFNSTCIFSFNGSESIIDQAYALRLHTIILCVLTLLTSWLSGERFGLSAL